MPQFGEKTLILQRKCARLMTEIHKKYRLTSMEEPTDEMLQELMEDVDELFGTYTREDQLRDAYRLKNKEIGYRVKQQEAYYD